MQPLRQPPVYPPQTKITPSNAAPRACLAFLAGGKMGRAYATAWEERDHQG